MTSSNLILVVTGASRGLGRSIAVTFGQPQQSPANDDNAPTSMPYQHLEAILIARDEHGLQETRQAMQQQQQQQQQQAMTMEIHCHAMDLGHLQTLEGAVETLMQQLSEIVHKGDAPRELVFINNAGSLGHIGPCSTIPSLADMQGNVDLNITSALYLSARMLRFVKEHASFLTKASIVNISSLVAVQAFPSLALYSAGKAARDLYHAAMAHELEPESLSSSESSESCTIRILNYAPGPLETNMTTELRQAPDLHSTLKPHYDKQLIDSMDSAAKLVRLIRTGNFANGQHVDYYDITE